MSIPKIKKIIPQIKTIIELPSLSKIASYGFSGLYLIFTWLPRGCLALVKLE